MKLKLSLYAAVVASTVITTAHAQPARGIADRDIVEAYEYMLGRWLVLRQENLDFKEGFKWNQIIHREPGGVDWANPNLDVVYSEAWVAVDDKSCTLIELPEIKGRYTRAGTQRLGRSHCQCKRAHPSQTSVRKVCFLCKGHQGDAAEGTLRINVPSKNHVSSCGSNLGPISRGDRTSEEDDDESDRLAANRLRGRESGFPQQQASGRRRFRQDRGNWRARPISTPA